MISKYPELPIKLLFLSLCNGRLSNLKYYFIHEIAIFLIVHLPLIEDQAKVYIKTTRYFFIKIDDRFLWENMSTIFTYWVRFGLIRQFMRKICISFIVSLIHLAKIIHHNQFECCQLPTTLNLLNYVASIFGGRNHQRSYNETANTIYMN